MASGACGATGEAASSAPRPPLFAPGTPLTPLHPPPPTPPLPSLSRSGFLKWYALYNIANTVVSIVVGGVVLAGVDVECASAASADTCNDVGVLYGVILTLGSSSVGVFAAINSGLAYLSMRDTAPTPDARKVDL